MLCNSALSDLQTTITIRSSLVSICYSISLYYLWRYASTCTLCIIYNIVLLHYDNVMQSLCRQVVEFHSSEVLHTCPQSSDTESGMLTVGQSINYCPPHSTSLPTAQYESDHRTRVYVYMQVMGMDLQWTKENRITYSYLKNSIKDQQMLVWLHRS